MNWKQLIVLFCGMAAILLFDFIKLQHGANFYFGLLFLALLTGGGIYTIRDKKTTRQKMNKDYEKNPCSGEPDEQ